MSSTTNTAANIKTFEDLQAYVSSGRRVVVSDFEYINEALGDARPTQAQWKEVVQMGAVEIVNGAIGKSFNIKVHPRIKKDALTPAQWEAFTEITNVKKEDVLSPTLMFEEAWQQYVNFINGDVIVVISGDREVSKWNWTLVGAPKDDEIDRMNWVILKPLLAEPLRKYFSGQLHEQVKGVPFEFGQESLISHDCFRHAQSMAHFVLHYRE